MKILRVILWVLVVAIALAALGHIFLHCVPHHHGDAVEQVCQVCGQPESACICKQTIDGLRAQLVELQTAERELPAELELGDEECNHPHWDENTLEDWSSIDTPVIIGTEDECISYYCGQKAICADCGEEIIIAHYTTEVGHQFDDNGTCIRCGYTKPTPPTKTVIYSSVTTTKFTVTFDSAGGTAIPAQVVEKGKTAVEPKDPTREGYVFSGWCLGEKTFEFTTPITADVILTAVWTAKSEPSPAPISEPSPTPEPCKHPTTYNKYGEWEFYGVMLNDPVEDGHILVYTRLVYQYCEECGVLLKTSQEVDRRSEAHEFNGAGKCTVCGYEKPTIVYYTVPGNTTLGEDSGEAPGTIGETTSETYTDPGITGTQVEETFEAPDTAGVPVETFEAPDTAGIPVPPTGGGTPLGSDSGTAGGTSLGEDSGEADGVVEYTDTTGAGIPIPGE